MSHPQDNNNNNTASSSSVSTPWRIYASSMANNESLALNSLLGGAYQYPSSPSPPHPSSSSFPAWVDCSLFLRFPTSQRVCEWKPHKDDPAPCTLSSSGCGVSSQEDDHNDDDEESTGDDSDGRCGLVTHNATLPHCPAIEATLLGLPTTSRCRQWSGEQQVEEGEDVGGITLAVLRDLLNEFEWTQPRGCWKVTGRFACECQYAMILRYKTITVLVTRVDDICTSDNNVPIFIGDYDLKVLLEECIVFLEDYFETLHPPMSRSNGSINNIREKVVSIEALAAARQPADDQDPLASLQEQHAFVPIKILVHCTDDEDAFQLAPSLSCEHSSTSAAAGATAATTTITGGLDGRWVSGRNACPDAAASLASPGYYAWNCTQVSSCSCSCSCSTPSEELQDSELGETTYGVYQAPDNDNDQTVVSWTSPEKQEDTFNQDAALSEALSQFSLLDGIYVEHADYKDAPLDRPGTPSSIAASDGSHICCSGCMFGDEEWFRIHAELVAELEQGTLEEEEKEDEVNGEDGDEEGYCTPLTTPPPPYNG